MGTIRESVQTLNGETIEPSTLLNVGKPIFLSRNAVSDTETLQQVQGFYAAIHAPTFGTPIPGSNKTATGSGGVILAPSTNETAYVNGLSLHNTSATDAAEFSIYNSNALIATGAVPSQSAVVIVGFGAEGMPPFYLVNGQSVSVNFTGAGAADASFICSYALAVQ